MKITLFVFTGLLAAAVAAPVDKASSTPETHSMIALRIPNDY